MITFVDYYVTSFIAFLPAAFEMIAVAWSYGTFFCVCITFASNLCRFFYYLIVPDEIKTNKFRIGQLLERYRIYAQETTVDVLAALLECFYSWNYPCNLHLYIR